LEKYYKEGSYPEIIDFNFGYCSEDTFEKEVCLIIGQDKPQVTTTNVRGIHSKHTP